MTTTLLKAKITKRLEEMDVKQLKITYLFLQELSSQNKLHPVALNEEIVNEKIAKGIKQLEAGEGTDFGIFLNDVKANYGRIKSLNP